jgi:hypothetical protein
MSFEMAGFLVGMSGVGSVLWLLYRRQTTRMKGAIMAGLGERRRG